MYYNIKNIYYLLHVESSISRFDTLDNNNFPACAILSRILLISNSVKGGYSGSRICIVMFKSFFDAIFNTNPSTVSSETGISYVNIIGYIGYPT